MINGTVIFNFPNGERERVKFLSGRIRGMMIAGERPVSYSVELIGSLDITDCEIETLNKWLADIPACLAYGESNV